MSGRWPGWAQGVAHRTVARDPLGGRTVALLTYRADQPYEVAALFRDDNRWVFARDLLAEGLTGPCGDGDVRIAPILRDEILLYLSSDDGSVSLYLPRAHVERFLGATFALVPAGREEMDFDAELAELLAAGAGGGR